MFRKIHKYFVSNAQHFQYILLIVIIKFLKTCLSIISNEYLKYVLINYIFSHLEEYKVIFREENPNII